MGDNISMKALTKPDSLPPSRNSDHNRALDDDTTYSSTTMDKKEELPVEERDFESNDLSNPKVEKVTEAESSEFDVWWNDDQDPENPQNWTAKKKWSNIAVMSSITFLT